ncbi:Phosphodiesterase [Paragonimus heterotremus]|uniref:3',5'-cyclic-nucleotide phosphodiesterase n=1 Tax=Paragonimus heterotremus TaxID=100268 RepID=A0A8J4WJJ1_9TREM|nr:Phosphodiesterase [Paragonimus heterotremus]
MGSCTSTGVSRAESPIRSLSTSRSHDCFGQPRRMSPTRRLSSLTPKGFDQKHIQFNQQTGSANQFENSVDLLELGVGNDDIPLRTVGPLITDAHLDNECTNLGVSPNFYKNLATCSLGEYARVPTDTDYFHAAHTPEAMRAAYTRMRQLYEAIEQDRVGKATLLKNLHYSITVMEASYIAERRRIREEEEDLSEAATEYVPNEVRDWLASTFTRTQPIVGIGDQKPRFRSVANAIRAGIFVERIYRRMSSCTNLIIPPNVLMFLKTELDTWSFDVFALNEASENHSLKFVGYELFHKYNLINKFQINTNNLECLFIQLEVGYSKYSNPYHNLIHAADVMQTCHMILHMNDLRYLTILNGRFYSELALIYNDRGVLENHHVSAIFRLIQDPEFDIFTGLNKDQFKEFRQLVIDMVLCTDMSLHFQQIKNMKSMITMPENVDKTKALSLIVHCADIGHPAKKWSLHEQWTKVLCEEFFRQACYHGYGVTFRSQRMLVGFIDFIVEPCFQVLGDMIERIISPPAVLPGSTPDLERKQNGSEKNLQVEPPAVSRPWVECFKENKQTWATLATESKPKT